MQKQVVLEVGLLGEATAADMTLERPRAVVDVHVALQVARCREGLGAQLTLVRLLLKQGETTISVLNPFHVPCCVGGLRLQKITRFSCRC